MVGQSGMVGSDGLSIKVGHGNLNESRLQSAGLVETRMICGTDDRSCSANEYSSWKHWL